ncbi:MAG: amidohydrolase family protein [Candidatus Cloacimonas sp.]|nr:amidohydrolase family protein [Candidatus Cloacimonas sp.]
MIFDIVLEGGTVITMDAQSQILENYCIGIKDGTIQAIFPEGSSSYETKQKIDTHNCLIIPGLINMHSHLPMTYFRGLADDLPLNIWLQKYIWPLEAKLIKPQFVYDATLHSASEMIKNGISTTNDMYFCMNSIADACSQAGLRVLIGEVMIDDEPSKNSPENTIGKKIEVLKEEYKNNPLIDFTLAPHSIYACSSQTLKTCAEIAKNKNILIHTHLSETREEVENCLKMHNKRPVEYLQELGLLEVRSIFAHGIWIDEREMELLAEKKLSSIAVCTESNLKLSSGFIPVKMCQEKGINLCLGTDGVASNNNLDLLTELSVTAKLHKALNNDPALLPAKEAFAFVTINAAKALGKEKELGSLEKGKIADIAVVTLQELENNPVYNPYSLLVYAINSNSIRDMIIQGKIVMHKRQLCNVNEQQLLDKATDYKEMILQATEQ